jgi:hypothetical protein
MQEKIRTMKNIHLLQTDKASRVLYNSTLKSFCIQKEIDGMFINDGKVSGADFWGLEKALNNRFQPQNIYITNDEHPKPNNFYFDFENQKVKKCETGYYNKGSKKIILTTDQDLIKDGVQEIDDEFLEWFVKNPSCEEVEVDNRPKISSSERMYSEEDMNQYADYVLMCSAEKTFKLPLPPKEWFEKFKKKIRYGNSL